MKVLAQFDAAAKPSNDVVAHLQSAQSIPRYWARALTTAYLKTTK
jgi:hypothetical protein